MIQPEVRKKCLRLVALIRFFDKGGEISARELAGLAGTSVRTADRLLRDVECFVPLVVERRGRYRRMH